MSGFQDPETYRTILESLQTGICVVDLRRKILLWSDGAEQITGYLRHEVVGHECVDNMLPHCNQAGCELCGDHCPLNAATREFKPVESLGFLHHKSGHRTPVHMWSAPARDARGSIIGIIQSFYNQRYVPSPDRRDGNRGSWVDAATGVASGGSNPGKQPAPYGLCRPLGGRPISGDSDRVQRAWFTCRL